MVSLESAEPSRRVVLLGASNVTRGIAAVLAACRQCWSEPLDVLCAIGHGRSYGRPSRVLGRRLPGIRECGIWEAICQREPLPSAALVTDIGNDILFGATVDTIVEWVAESMDRLADHGATMIVTELPLESVARLSPARFRLFRRLLFPKSTVEFSQAMQMAGELNERVLALAKRHNAVVARPHLGWYAIDPIHIRYRHFGTAWPELLRGWNAAVADVPVGHSWKLWLKLRTRRPLQQRLFGFEMQTPQPACCFADGTRVSWY